MDLDTLRQSALGHATHDMKGNTSAEVVVERAKAYLRFLSGKDDGLTPPNFDGVKILIKDD